MTLETLARLVVDMRAAQSEAIDQPSLFGEGE